MRKYIVDKEEKLFDFLLKVCKDQSRNQIKGLLSKKQIYVDDQLVTQFDYQLKVNQMVFIGKKDTNKLNLPFEILYEDHEIIIIDKPAGLLSMASLKEKNKTAYHYLMEYEKHKNKNNRIFIVHRLDQDTSGILLFAKNETIKKKLQDDWNQIVLKRGYLALIEGNLNKKKGTIHTWLKETKTFLVYSSNKPNDGQEAITHYEVIKENPRNSLLQIYLDTGRKNQIRVHMQTLGHSIVGDRKYGANSDPIKRLGLHANILEFIHPVTKKHFKFETVVPKSFMI